MPPYHTIFAYTSITVLNQGFFFFFFVIKPLIPFSPAKNQSGSHLLSIAQVQPSDFHRSFRHVYKYWCGTEIIFPLAISTVLICIYMGTQKLHKWDWIDVNQFLLSKEIIRNQPLQASPHPSNVKTWGCLGTNDTQSGSGCWRLLVLWELPHSPFFKSCGISRPKIV